MGISVRWLQITDKCSFRGFYSNKLISAIFLTSRVHLFIFISSCHSLFRSINANVGSLWNWNIISNKLICIDTHTYIFMTVI